MCTTIEALCTKYGKKDRVDVASIRKVFTRYRAQLARLTKDPTATKTARVAALNVVYTTTDPNDDRYNANLTGWVCMEQSLLSQLDKCRVDFVLRPDKNVTNEERVAVLEALFNTDRFHAINDIAHVHIHDDDGDESHLVEIRNIATTLLQCPYVLPAPEPVV